MELDFAIDVVLKLPDRRPLTTPADFFLSLQEVSQMRYQIQILLSQLEKKRERHTSVLRRTEKNMESAREAILSAGPEMQAMWEGLERELAYIKAGMHEFKRWTDKTEVFFSQLLDAEVDLRLEWLALQNQTSKAGDSAA